MGSVQMEMSVVSGESDEVVSLATSNSLLNLHAVRNANSTAGCR